MTKLDRLIALCAVLTVLIFVGADLYIGSLEGTPDKSYRVEVNRVRQQLEADRDIDLSDYEQITAVTRYDSRDSFFKPDTEYVIAEADGQLWRIDYEQNKASKKGLYIAVNSALGALSAVLFSVLLYIRSKIVRPFNRIRDYPVELSKGHLTKPLKEEKSKHFGRFVWGLDMLRERLEDNKQKELDHARTEKTMLLSLSHDIKTPLSAIKLSAQALSKGIYKDTEKQKQTALGISSNADEIERYVAEIIRNAEHDFMTFDVQDSQFYLSTAVDKTESYYRDKLSVLGTEFTVGEYADCLLRGDPERMQEVLQNIIENAVKYGDGKRISLSFSEEEDCRLITVSNTGCSLPESELDTIFESFRRGSNSGSQPGSGLGLYICRRLMNEMGGEVFAETEGDLMKITIVCRKK